MKAGELAEFVYWQRIKRNLTQAEFGVLFGRTRQEICCWEKGRRLPDATSLLRLFELCGIKLAEEVEE